ncbi:MAG: VWA domain-containing protein [Defluviitaleaceae bacterium]|nr:VWA domain-containing protein [Defluviitaleaceae bacterium]
MFATRHSQRGIRLFFVLMFFVIFAMFIEGTTSKISAADATEGIDAILVIDTSGSMRTSDPERITLEAASLFMDMMETRNSRLGIVEFSGNLHTVRPLTPIGEISVRDEIRQEISNFVYHGWTDIGLALRTAAEMINEDPIATNSPIIILFTDGRIDLGTQLDGRTTELSYEDAWWAVDNVGNVPIYTIGLNYDGALNIDFLQEIANRTNASYFIAEEADALPQVFNEIFASHIRSSLTEVTTIVAEGDTYAEVVIPIPSPFVSEANIIMLSSRPIASVRLFDPSGREVPFDGELYTLTYANRYSMIKVLSPMVGDWLLSVRGLPEDRITVNLIYNYNVSVSWSVTQPNVDDDGVFFDPNQPIMVQAGFISPLPASQLQTLFRESVAEMSVYDMEQNHVATFPMVNTATAFTLEFQLDPPQDVRINIGITHPAFSQTTTFFPITFDPEVLAELAALPPEPEQTPEPITEATPPPPQYEDIDTGSPIAFILIGIAIALVIAVLLIRLIVVSRMKQRVFTGHLELRARLSDGNYTALEAPDLSTFAGQMSLMEFLSNSLGGEKVDKLVQSRIPIWDIQLAPGLQGVSPIIYVTKRGSNCNIADSDGNVIGKSKIVWEDGQQLLFFIAGESPRLEVTYRAYEN